MNKLRFLSPSCNNILSKTIYNNMFDANEPAKFKGNILWQTYVAHMKIDSALICHNHFLIKILISAEVNVSLAAVLSRNKICAVCFRMITTNYVKPISQMHSVMTLPSVVED